MTRIDTYLVLWATGNPSLQSQSYAGDGVVKYFVPLAEGLNCACSELRCTPIGQMDKGGGARIAVRPNCVARDKIFRAECLNSACSERRCTLIAQMGYTYIFLALCGYM